MSIFNPDPKKAVIREIRKTSNKSLKIVKLAGELAKCEDFFITAIRTECLSLDKARALMMPALGEKERIRDAVIGLLATEELNFDLNSIESDLLLDKALGRMSLILAKMQLMSPGTPSIGIRDIFGEMNADPESPVDISALSQRAVYVDSFFIDKLISGVLTGASIKPLVHKLLKQSATQRQETSSEEPFEVDFTKYADQSEPDSDILEMFSEMR